VVVKVYTGGGQAATGFGKWRTPLGPAGACFGRFSDRKKANEGSQSAFADLLAAGKVHAAQMSEPERASYGRACELVKPTGLPAGN